MHALEAHSDVTAICNGAMVGFCRRLIFVARNPHIFHRLVSLWTGCVPSDMSEVTMLHFLIETVGESILPGTLADNHYFPLSGLGGAPAPKRLTGLSPRG